MKKLTTNQKKALLAKLIEIYVMAGKDITNFMGKPLSHWDYAKILEAIQKEESNQYGEIITK